MPKEHQLLGHWFVYVMTTFQNILQLPFTRQIEMINVTKTFQYAGWNDQWLKPYNWSKRMDQKQWNSRIWHIYIYISFLVVQICSIHCYVHLLSVIFCKYTPTWCEQVLFSLPKINAASCDYRKLWVCVIV
jgi:hypothetical protein